MQLQMIIEAVIYANAYITQIPTQNGGTIAYFPLLGQTSLLAQFKEPLNYRKIKKLDNILRMQLHVLNKFNPTTESW